MGKTFFLFFILFKEYEVKKDEGFLYIISERAWKVIRNSSVPQRILIVLKELKGRQ